MPNDNKQPAAAPSPVGQQPARVLPGRIIEANFAFAQSCILLAAVELDLFTLIDQGLNTAGLLAEQAHAMEGPLKRLLGALTAMGFLLQQEGLYMLTPVSERFLVRNKESYIGDLSLQTRQEWDTWIHLTDIVCSGQPPRFINEEPLGGAFFAPLAASLFPLMYPLMRVLCQRLGVGTQLHGAQVLDLGAGAAPEAIAALEQDAEAHAVVIDFPEVVARAHAYAEKHEVASRMEYWPAKLETLELPRERFDLVFASHVLRIVGAEITRSLLHQCYQSLKPQGRLIVVETYNDQAEKLFPQIVSLNMLVNTRHGDTFTSQQMHAWLTSAGFQVAVWQDIGPDPVMVATRPALREEEGQTHDKRRKAN